MIPFEIRDGLALYRTGKGPEVFLMPYPHASAYRPASEGRFAELLIHTGFSVLTYDPPGFARSSRQPVADLDEIISCTLECLDHFKIKTSVPFIGHSMSGFCVLGFTLKYPAKVSSILISGSPSGWKDVYKYSIHRKWKLWDKKFWQTRYWGARIILNNANLKIHRQLDNLTAYECFYNKNYFEKIPIEKADSRKPAPPRAIWLNNVRKYELEDELKNIVAPVLITSGLYDPLVPVKVSKKMQELIPGAKIAIFEKSGHSPFIEEKVKYSQIAADFLHKE